MGIVENTIALRDQLINENGHAVPEQFSGVSKAKITMILQRIDRQTADMIDAVFALLDTRPNWFSKAPKNSAFRDGASTAHIGAHVRILQRGQLTKLDREGRDYWLIPLWEIGAIEKVTLDAKTQQFISGHVKSKSPNSAYRLAADFVKILSAPDGQWETMFDQWVQTDAIKERLNLQAQLAEQARTEIDNSHSNLIKACQTVYASRFLSGYLVVYIDDGDGDRISETQQERLAQAGLMLSIDDVMPDVLLWNPDTDQLWVIEAVTSDGEVDLHKKNSLIGFTERHHKASIGFTTAYPTWKKAAERQGKLKNLADDTWLWIQEDPSRNIYISQNTTVFKE